MSNIFQPKRVKVPGLLSDEGLAVAIKDLSGAAKTTAETAPLPESAYQAADKIMGATTPSPTLKPAQQSTPQLGLPAQTPKAPATGFGMLTPEQQVSEKKLIVDAAKEEERIAAETAILNEQTYRMTDEEYAAQTGLNPMLREFSGTTQEELRRQDNQEVISYTEQRKAVEDGPAPTMTWWMNAAQVGAKSAAKVGTSALKFPAVAFENLVYAGTGFNTGKTFPRVWLDQVDKGLDAILPGDKARSKEFVSELAAGGGSMIPFMLAGYLGRVIGLPAATTSGGLGAAVGGVDQYEDAENFKANGLQRMLAFMMGAGLGATEAIPIDRMFFRADNASGGMVRRLLQNTQASSLEEFIQETSQSMGEDIVAKYGAGYDPNRELKPAEWLKQGLVGAIVGGGAGALATVLPGGQRVEGDVDEAQLTAAVEEALTSEQATFDAILGDEAVDLPGGVEAPAAAAPVAAAEPVVTGDAVKQVIASVKAAQQMPAAPVEQQDVVLNPEAPTEQQVSVQPAPAIETPEFKAWFKDSAVRRLPTSSRDPGPFEPLKVYHGTQAEFTEFSKTNVGTTTMMGIPIKVFRRGNFFAEDKAFAESFANQGRRKGKVIEAYLSIQNPLWLSEGAVNNEDAKKLIEAGLDAGFVNNWLGDPKTTWEAFESADSAEDAAFFVDAVQRAGFDGVRMTEIDPDEQTGDGTRDVWVAFEPTQIKSATANDGSFDVDDPNIESQQATAPNPIDAIQLEPADLSPLPAIEKGLTGPIPRVVQAAKAYAAAVGMPHRRAREYVKVDVNRAARIAKAYADMKHEPQDLVVLAAYRAMADETIAQYQFVKATGLKIDAMQDGQPDPYPNGPRDVLKDIASGHIWYFPTKFGFGSDATFDPKDNPLLEPTEFSSDNGEPMLVNDLFRVVHDFFGHGLEGTGFGARGEENAWQSHMRLYSASAVPAMTSETRGQNSWVNYGPFGEQNRANPRDTVYADQKTGLMPSWTWQEGVADSQAAGVSAPVEGADATQFRDAIQAAKDSSPFGAVVHVYRPAEYAKMRLFLTPDGLSGFALDGEDIVSVFSHNNAPRGRLRQIIDTAITNGGRTLDAFDTGLPAMYARLGFKETSRLPWDPNRAPKNWPAELGSPDVVFMEYDGDVEQLVAAPLFGNGKLDVTGSGPKGRILVKDVAQAITDRHMLIEGKKLFPENSEEDYERVLNMASDDFAAQLERPNSGIGWYSTDVANAVDMTSRLFPTLATDDSHRDLYLTFAGIFSNGLDPDQAWQLSSEAFRGFIETGAIPVDRPNGKKWGVRNQANEQQLAFIGWLVEREGGVTQAMEWLKGQQKRTDINKAMIESGLYKEGRFTTKATQQGETFGFLALGEKLGRYTLGLHGVELEADNTTVDLWYTRTFRRWTGRLFDTPIGDAGIAGGVANDAERATVFRLTGDLQKQHPRLTAGDVQAVLWFFEKRLYAEHGINTNEGTNSSGARKLLGSVGVDASEGGPAAGRSGSEAGQVSPSLGSADIERMTGTASTRNPYAAEPQRPARGVAAKPTDEANDVKLTQISRNFVKLLNLTARHGRLVNGKDTFGEYSKRTTVVRLRVWSDLSTLVHEGGHALNDAMAAPLNAFVDRNAPAIRKISTDYYAGDLSNAGADVQKREGFAEFFRVYALTPDFARNKWPQLVADFEGVLKAEDPKLLEGLGTIANQFKAWLMLPSKRLIRNMVVDGRREQGIEAAVKELKDKGFKTWFQEHTRRSVEWSTNRFAPLNTLVTELLNQGQAQQGYSLDLKRADDPRTIVRLARNAGSRAMVEVTDGVYGYRSTQPSGPGLRTALLTALGVDPESTPGSLDEERMKDFDAYLVARRALDEYRRFEEGKLDRPPVGAHKGDVIRAIKDYEKQYKGAFTTAAGMVHDYGMALWQKQYDAGLMSKQTYEENLERQFYVPLQRDMSDKKADFGPSALTGGGGLRSTVKMFRGSDRDIISPMAVLMQKTFALETLIAENDTIRSIALLADRAGAAGALVERIPATQVLGMTMSVEDAARQLSKDDTLTATDSADLMTILGASIKEGNSISLFRRDNVSTQGENILFFWENGKPAAIQLKDGDLGADVINTLQGIGRENLPLWTDLVAGTSAAFRTAITSWPDFLVVNYIRDQMSAWILSDVGFVPFVSGAGGIADEVRQKTWAKLYNAAGGIMGGMNVAALHNARVDRDIKALRSKGYIAQAFSDKTPILGAIRGFASVTAVSETGTRLGLFKGAYKRAIKDGLTPYEASVEAAYTATDYIDFGLNGSRMTVYRKTIPFLNAQIQGFYKMLRTLGADEVAQRKGLTFVLGAYFKSVKNMDLSRTEKLALNTGRKAWVKMASLGLLSALLHFLFRDDPDYEEAGEYLRVTGWVIPMGDGRIFYIPKPFELALVANAVERGLEYASGDDQAPARFLRGAAQSLTPPTSPTALQIVTELTVNKDFFTGREIVPSYMQALAPQLQYDNYTSSLAKWLGGVTGQSPMIVDHILSGLGASAYRDIAAVTNAADPTRPSLDETDMPLLRRFVRDVRRGSVSAQDFWAQASQTTGRLERASQSYKRFIDAANEVAANQFLGTLNADERAYAQLMTHFKVEEKKLNPFYRARQITTIVSAMRRELASSLGLGDTTLKDDPQSFQMTAKRKQQVDELLSEIGRREVRNTLIATEQPGWEGKRVLPLEPTLDMLQALDPDTYDEYQRRYSKRKIYDAETVFEAWPDIRDRLNADGEFAVLADVTAIAGAGL